MGERTDSSAWDLLDSRLDRAIADRASARTCAAGDHADAVEQHRLLQPLNRFLEYDPGYVSPAKEALAMLGISCGPVREPLPDFPEAERPALQHALAGLGALEAVAG